MREQAEDRVALLTPVIKAYFTDFGFENCNLCLQVLGGHGYIAEWGMEQLVRDARIAQIYEGANGIHALDLVARKLPMHDGRLINDFIAQINRFTRLHADSQDMREFIAPLQHAVGLLEQGTDWIAAQVRDNPEVAGASSYDYLRLLALTSLGWMWARSAGIALAERDGDNSGFYDNKLLTARFFMQRLLPQADSLLQSLCTGAEVLMDMEAEAF